MSYKTSLIKMAINLAPKSIILWVANIVLKGIARLIAFDFNLDARTVYVQVQLYGETESIEVWVEDFAVFKQELGYCFVVHKAHANKLWLTNVFAKVTGKYMPLPEIPKLSPYMGLVAELFPAQPIKIEQLNN